MNSRNGTGSSAKKRGGGGRKIAVLVGGYVPRSVPGEGESVDGEVG